MQKLLSVILSLLILVGTIQGVGPLSVLAAETNSLIINQVYGSGPLDGSGSVSNSFVELYNPTGKAVSLAGWSLQIQNGNENSGTAATDWKKLNLSDSQAIAPYSSFLIRLQDARTFTSSDTIRYVVSNADVDWTDSGIILSNRAYSVALVSNQTLLSKIITANEISGVVDLIGAKNTGANDKTMNHEAEPLADVSKQKAARRKNFQDTDNNATDLESIDYRASGTSDVQLEEVRPRWSGDGQWGIVGSSSPAEIIGLIVESGVVTGMNVSMNAASTTDIFGIVATYSKNGQLQAIEASRPLAAENGTGVKTLSFNSGISISKDSVLNDDYIMKGYLWTVDNIPLTSAYTYEGEQIPIEPAPIKQYTVTFVDWDGAVIGVDNAAYGNAAVAPTDPIREGYAFTGWDKDFSNITGTLTVTAEYKPTAASEFPNIVFFNDRVETTGSKSGYTVTDTSVVISESGTYYFSGISENGSIDVSSNSGDVTIVLKGLSLSSTTTAPIRLRGGTTNVTITVAEGTSNYLSDTDRAAESPKSAINVSKDLLINGTGYLEVKGNNKNGIKSDTNVTIEEATLKVTSVDNGIAADNILTINSGNITVISGGDALKSDPDTGVNAEFAGRIVINDGIINLTSDFDGIQAEGDLNIHGGNFTVKTGRGSSYPVTNADDSLKGMKSRLTFTITGGTFDFDCSDDAVHSDSVINISGGNFEIKTADDAIHADETLTISENPVINIAKSYEGLESLTVNVMGGTIHIVSSDDGINAAGGVDQSGTPWRPPQTSLNGLINITGGYIVINAAGDGIDANGNIRMSGGTVIIHGPTSNMDGAIDYDGTFVMTGGVIVAAGNSGMSQAPGTSSTQRAVKITYRSTQSAGTMMNIRNSSGTSILTFRPSKNYSSVVFCSPDIASGQTYSIYSGVMATDGTEIDGLYTGGTISGGTSRGSFTSNSVITNVNAN